TRRPANCWSGSTRSTWSTAPSGWTRCRRTAAKERISDEPRARTLAVRRLRVRDVVPALDILRAARLGADVAGRRPDQSAGLLLLHDVRGPPGRASTAEQRRHHVRRHLGEIEDDRGPEL